jgi:hypothetical protein
VPHPFPLATVLTGGMRRDIDRTEIPGGSAYNMVDFIPDEIQAITAGRGGWTYSGPVLAGTPPSSIAVIGYHPDLAEVVVTDGTTIWDAVSGASLGTGFIGTAAPPAYHRGYLIYGARFNAGLPKDPYALKDDGTIAAISGAAPGTIPGVYKDHAILAKQLTNQNPSSTTAHLNRIWFSAPGDPTTWDTTFGWWDTTGTIVGLATLLNAVLIFHVDSTERLRGTTPPPGSDMVLEPFLPNVGCIDNRSIAYWQNRVVWASSQGIHLSDGGTVVDLTANAQMKTYWNSLISAGYTRIAGGIYRDHYIVSVNNGSTLVDCLCVSLLNQTIWRFSNLHGSGFVNVQAGQQEKLYMGLNNAGRVAELSSLWSPSASVKKDGDNSVPTPIVETGMFRGFDHLHRRWIESMGKQKWRFSYVDYDLRDAAADNPSMVLSYCTDPAGSYTQAGSAIPETTQPSRVRRPLSPTQGGATRSQMLGLKLAVTGPSASAKLYAVEGVFEPIEIGAL